MLVQAERPEAACQQAERSRVDCTDSDTPVLRALFPTLGHTWILAKQFHCTLPIVDEGPCGKRLDSERSTRIAEINPLLRQILLRMPTCGSFSSKERVQLDQSPKMSMPRRLQCCWGPIWPFVGQSVLLLASGLWRLPNIASRSMVR
jgi:hypothetical protein